MHRIKLNDRMTFPDELDMSPFIDVEDEVRDGTPPEVSSRGASQSHTVKHGCSLAWKGSAMPVVPQVHPNGISVVFHLLVISMKVIINS